MTRIWLLIGLSNGDETKGGTVDWLTANYPVKTIFRYNGGAQAAHNVVAASGVTHCFAQLGSGLLAAPVSTYLSRYVAVNPLSLMVEYRILESKINFSIPEIQLDTESLIITPYHILINQMREISRGAKRYGSCGKGVGETMSDAKKYGKEVLRAKDLSNFSVLKHKLRCLQALKIEEGEQLLNTDFTNPHLLSRLEKMCSEDYFKNLIDWYLDFSKWSGVKLVSSLTIDPESDIIGEGAQGILLDRDYGFYPHVTQSNTSFHNAEELIKENKLVGEVIKIGVLRAYATRHGAGPLVTYDQELATLIPDIHNTTNDFQGDFKIGWLDLVTTRYALKIAGEIKGIALSCLDRLQTLKEVKTCTSYKYNGPEGLEVLKQFFECHSIGEHFRPIITDIKLIPANRVQDLSWRQKITDILNDCEPVYRVIKVKKTVFINEYVEHLETALKTKILLVSTGPTAGDKKILRPLL
jgi:adenylosuccinate synthase